MEHQIALCEAQPEDISDAAAVPEWVHVLPLGNVKTRDGRSFIVRNPDKLVAAFKVGNVDLAVDFDHQIDEPKARPAIGQVVAAGWLKQLEVRENGIWGQVEWTKAASEMIANKEFRYLSPVISYDAVSRQVIDIKGLSLVHRPAMHLTALSSERSPAPVQDAAISLVRATLGLGPEADTATVIATLRERLTPDPAKFVPVEIVTDLLHDRNAKVALMSEREAIGKVDQAMDGGYLTPAMRPWAIALCKADPDSFDAFLASAVPAFAHLFKPSITAVRPVTVQTAADPNGVAAILGLDPKLLG